MSPWTRERRTQVILIVVGTIGLVVFLWFSVIAVLQEWRDSEEGKLTVSRTKLQMTEHLIASAESNETEARRLESALEAQEGQMARGDLYRWVMNSLLDLEERDAVRFLTYDPPQVVDQELAPKVPYPVATCSATGIGRFADVGQFLADLENSHPYVRLTGLSLQSGAPGLILDVDPQQLYFRLEFSSLVSTNDPAVPK